MTRIMASSVTRAGRGLRIYVSALVAGALALTGSTAAMATMARRAATPAASSVDRAQPTNLDDAKHDIRVYYGDHRLRLR
jgi:hypothetical protein